MTNAIRIQLPNTVKSIVESVLTGLNTKITELQQENNSLRERVTILERGADTAEQYSATVSVLVVYRPKLKKTRTTTWSRCPRRLATIQDIGRSHSVGKKRDIIVKSSAYRARTRFYRSRVKAKDNGYRGIFVNGHLTKTRASLLYIARTLKSARTIDSCWSFDDIILVKDDSMKAFRINCAEGLNKF